MKRIYRLESDKMIAGICAGLGDYFSIDPTIIRLVAVFVCIATGIWPLVIAYIVGWIIIPDKSELPAGEETKEENKTA
ncbi:MAG: PspC domain-containing protein [Chitinivibrionales bacterium]|nr:PspC domain-containing protein [Chitinivibrionales bacterium]